MFICVSCALQFWRAISCSVGFLGFLRKRDHAMCKQIVLLFFFLLAGFVPAEPVLSVSGKSRHPCSCCSEATL